MVIRGVGTHAAADDYDGGWDTWIIQAFKKAPRLQTMNNHYLWPKKLSFDPKCEDMFKISLFLAPQSSDHRITPDPNPTHLG